MMTTRQLKVEPLPGATFGAVITEIDLTNLSRAMWADIEAAFNEHGMLIFPAQYLAADAPLRPLVKYHPVTRRPSLFVGRHAFGIPGMSGEESEGFLNELETFACQNVFVLLVQGMRKGTLSCTC